MNKNLFIEKTVHGTHVAYRIDVLIWIIKMLFSGLRIIILQSATCSPKSSISVTILKNI